MIAIYATALALGGVLVVIPALLGHHGVAGGHGGFHPGHGGLHHGHGGGVHHGPGGSAALSSALWLTVLSVRFWSYAAAFFGLTGVLFEELHLLDDSHEILALAGIVGAGSGLLASWIIARLRNDAVSSLPSEEGYVGLAAEVLLEIQPEEAGRIRLSSRGSLIDLPAKSQRGERLPAGSKVVVIEAKNGVASVVGA